MNPFRLRILLFLATNTFFFQESSAQDSLLSQLAIEHHLTFTENNGQFSGVGWEQIRQNTIKAQNVLIGEDHFSNEIPAFTKALSDVTRFDNFYIEVDPYSTRIIEATLKELGDSEREEFNKEFGDVLSFYSLVPEYDLLKHISDAGTRILGSDQVVMYADRLIFDDLRRRTKDQSKQNHYASMIKKSEQALERFYSETKNPMTLYFMTPEFQADLTALEKMSLTEEEQQIITDMRRSVTIYTKQSHSLRIKLILNQLMKDYPLWKDSKNLFKYGANHMTRGESFLTVYDMGNMVANITASNYQESYHIMIVGESGMLGSIFKIFPPTKVDVDKGFYLSYLKPFFEITEGDDWYLFDLTSLRKQLNKGKLVLTNTNLIRAIKGYDALVIIPEVTAAQLME